jgi:hypothetical protein
MIDVYQAPSFQKLALPLSNPGLANLDRAELSEVHESFHLLLNCICVCATRPSPEIMPVARHLESTGRHSPYHHVRGHHRIAHIARDAGSLIRGAYAEDIGADGDEVHDECDDCDGEEHDSRPEHSRCCPGMDVAREYHVLSKVILCDGERQCPDHIAVQEQRENAGD